MYTNSCVPSVCEQVYVCGCVSLLAFVFARVLTCACMREGACLPARGWCVRDAVCEEFTLLCARACITHTHGNESGWRTKTPRSETMHAEEEGQVVVHSLEAVRDIVKVSNFHLHGVVLAVVAVFRP